MIPLYLPLAVRSVVFLVSRSHSLPYFHDTEAPFTPPIHDRIEYENQGQLARQDHGYHGLDDWIGSSDSRSRPAEG